MGHFVDKKDHDEYIEIQNNLTELLKKQMSSNSSEEIESLKKEIRILKTELAKYEEILKLKN
ncbi:hypothetical protein [Lysinibacillus pakistanensis]|uniref:Uncharacterized protein n=1 Tax=Lysinibacillus pakistanensis TaxID=759811 RepID=A0AAX3WZD3_9BACI|nr:hypothetical protein [Lysinibacillus pakistanensis]MDM5231472.1 hypothetical protein [Lysinibacillus pakistanensis]WHY47019.1 hypothetical protein QNH22_02025 [Lysinibacillus pakistanensis]WHY52031.1 hypothetical protein QNH24_02020 [Lysinibacillus pakistanensis]